MSRAVPRAESSARLPTLTRLCTYDPRSEHHITTTTTMRALLLGLPRCGRLPRSTLPSVTPLLSRFYAKPTKKVLRPFPQPPIRTSTYPLPDRANTLLTLYEPPGSTDTTPVILYHPYPTSNVSDLFASSYDCRILTLTHPDGPPRFPHLLHDFTYAIHHTRTLFPGAHIGVFGAHSSGGLLLSATLTSPPGLISALGLFCPWTDITHRVFPTRESLENPKRNAPQLGWDENTASWLAAGVPKEVKDIYTDDPWVWQDSHASPALLFRQAYLEMGYDRQAREQMVRWVEKPNPVNATRARPLNVPAVMVGMKGGKGKKGDQEWRDLVRFLERGGKAKGRNVFWSDMSGTEVKKVARWLGRWLWLMEGQGKPIGVEKGEAEAWVEAKVEGVEEEQERRKERERMHKQVELKLQGLDLKAEAERLRGLGFERELVENFVDEGDLAWKLEEVVDGEEGEKEEMGEEENKGEEETEEERSDKSSQMLRKW